MHVFGGKGRRLFFSLSRFACNLKPLLVYFQKRLNSSISQTLSYFPDRLPRQRRILNYDLQIAMLISSLYYESMGFIFCIEKKCMLDCAFSFISIK